MTIGQRLKRLDDRWVPLTRDPDPQRRKTSGWLVSLVTMIEGAVALVFAEQAERHDSLAGAVVTGLIAASAAAVGMLSAHRPEEGDVETRRSTGRTSAAVVAASVGVVLIWLSWGPLRNLSADYQDSHVLVYVLIGGLFLVPGVALVSAAASALRQSWGRGAA